MEGIWKIAAAHNDHDKAVQMMSRFSHSFLDGPNIGGRWCGNRLRMGMPVPDKMQSVPMHLVDLSLFLATVGEV